MKEWDSSDVLSGNYNVGLIAMLRVGGSLSSQFILNDHFEWTTEKKK